MVFFFWLKEKNKIPGVNKNKWNKKKRKKKLVLNNKTEI